MYEELVSRTQSDMLRHMLKLHGTTFANSIKKPRFSTLRNLLLHGKFWKQNSPWYLGQGTVKIYIFHVPGCRFWSSLLWRNLVYVYYIHTLVWKYLSILWYTACTWGHRFPWLLHFRIVTSYAQFMVSLVWLCGALFRAPAAVYVVEKMDLLFCIPAENQINSIDFAFHS